MLKTLLQVQWKLSSNVAPRNLQMIYIGAKVQTPKNHFINSKI